MDSDWTTGQRRVSKKAGRHGDRRQRSWAFGSRPSKEPDFRETSEGERNRENRTAGWSQEQCSSGQQTIPCRNLLSYNVLRLFEVFRKSVLPNGDSPPTWGDMANLMCSNNQETENIEKAQNGDRGAFDSLLEQCRDQLEYFVHMRFGSHLKGVVEVDDVIQESSLRAFRSLSRFNWEGQGSFFRWLKGIAEHVILETASTQRRRPTFQLDHDEPEENPSCGKALRREQRFERLQESFNSLSPEYRKVILLARIRKLPLSVVAEKMHRSPAAVKQLLWRALQKLRSAFGDTESLHLPDRSLENGGGHGK